MTRGSHDSEDVPCVNGRTGTQVLAPRGHVASRRRPREYIGLGIILAWFLALGSWVLCGSAP